MELVVFIYSIDASSIEFNLSRQTYIIYDLSIIFQHVQVVSRLIFHQRIYSSTLMTVSTYFWLFLILTYGLLISFSRITNDYVLSIDPSYQMSYFVSRHLF